MTTIAERVSKGAAVLDEVRPDWRTEIDVEILDVGSTRACPLAQLYGRYTDGATTLSGVDVWDVGDWAADHGFEADDEAGVEDDEDNLGQYAALTEAWRAEVAR